MPDSRKGFAIVVLYLAMFWAGTGFAQNEAPVTISADSYTVTERDGQQLQQLTGNVRFTQGALAGRADEAVRNVTTNRIELRGNVVIRQDTLALEAPRVDYDANTRIGHAEGGVKLTDRDNRLTAVEGDYDANTQIAVFHGSVRIAQGTTIITSEQLTYYRTTQTSVARGKVQVKSDSGVLRADNVTHVRSIGEMTAVGNVSITSDSLDITSHWLYHSEPQDLMYASGKVVVLSRANKVIIAGDTLARFGKRQFVHVPRRPLLKIADSSITTDTVTGDKLVTYDTTYVKSSTMEIYQGDSARFIAIDSVRMLRSNFAAIGGKMIYDQASETIRLFEADRQRLWYDSSEIVGDSIAMQLRDNHVERAWAIGRSFTTTPIDFNIADPNDERIQQIQGERMMLTVERDTVRNMLVTNNALSIYFLVNDQRLDGMNRASGDSIRLDFAGRAVRRVAIISGTEGEYWPEVYIRGRGRAFRLTAFTRDLALRPRRPEFVYPWEQTPTRP